MTLRSQPAYSLIFAFIIVTVMMLIAVTTIQNTTDKITYYRGLEGGSMAYLAAQSAAENGVLAMKDYEAGYETSDTASFSADYDGDGTEETTGDFTIYANGQENDFNGAADEFYVPIPNTGTAGNAGTCSILQQDVGTGQLCNWNKMLYGEGVTIPLFTDSGGTLLFPYDSSIGFTNWKLKVRTPCVDPAENPDACTRYELDEGTGYPDDDASVILWQITGQGTVTATSADYEVSVVPDDTPATDSRPPYATIRNSSLNTEIYESLINSAPYNIVLEANDSSTSPDYSALYNACMGDTDGDPTSSEITLSSLFLQLDIVTPLRDVSGVSIPYLEWQFIVTSTEPLADNKSVIVGEGYHPGTEHTFYHPYTVTRSTTGESTGVYTLSN
jgi:hypothetical protein